MDLSKKLTEKRMKEGRLPYSDYRGIVFEEIMQSSDKQLYYNVCKAQKVKGYSAGYHIAGVWTKEEVIAEVWESLTQEEKIELMAEVLGEK